MRLLLVCGGLFSSTDGRRRLASRLTSDFTLCPAELAFARQLLGIQTQYWLFRSHQRQAAGDFIAVDRSSHVASSRWFAIELKRERRLRLGRPGMQLARCRQAVIWLAQRYGLAVGALTEVTGDAAAVTSLLRGARSLRLVSA